MLVGSCPLLTRLVLPACQGPGPCWEGVLDRLAPVVAPELALGLLVVPQHQTQLVTGWLETMALLAVELLVGQLGMALLPAVALAMLLVTMRLGGALVAMRVAGQQELALGWWWWCLLRRCSALSRC